MDKEKLTILGMAPKYFILLLIVTLVMSCTGYLLGNMIGAVCCALIVGTAIGFVGDRIPIWNQWLGGGILLANMVASVIATYHIFPKATVTALTTFNGKTGFLELYVVTLIFGSVLSVNRKLLIRSFVGYIPTILGAVAGSFLLCAGAAAIVGKSPIDTVLSIAMPIMGGGNGAGAIPMSKMWGEITGKDPSSWYAAAYATLTLGNIVAVLFAAILNKLGELHPSLTGHGQLMEVNDEVLAKTLNEKEEIGEITPAHYAAAFVMATFVYTFAHFYAGKVSIINNVLHLGFKVHKFAFMIIFVAILNIVNCIPAEIKEAAKRTQSFFVKYMSYPLLFCVGLGTNINDYIKVFSIQNMIIIFAIVLGACIGAAIIGKLFHFYPIEAMITAALCMANAGGSGDVQVLGTAKRMELMPYAQISSRIGGAIILLIASFMFGKYL